MGLQVIDYERLTTQTAAIHPVPFESAPIPISLRTWFDRQCVFDLRTIQAWQMHQSFREQSAIQTHVENKVECEGNHRHPELLNLKPCPSRIFAV